MVATIQKAIIFPQFPNAPPKLRKHDFKIYAHKSWQRKITSNIDAGFNYSVNRASAPTTRSLTPICFRIRASSGSVFQRRGVGVRGVGISALEEKIGLAYDDTNIIYRLRAVSTERERRVGLRAAWGTFWSRGLLRRMHVWRTWAPGKHTYNHNPKIITSAWQTHGGVSAYTQTPRVVTLDVRARITSRRMSWNMYFVRVMGLLEFTWCCD